MGQNPVSMDPQTVTQVSANQLVYAIYDPLVWQLVVDGKTQLFPGLAESWEVSDDLTEYTFHLREADFHDGTPFNADAVKYMLDRIADPDLEAGLAQGALGKAYESSQVIDDRTVKVIFSSPNGGFLTALGSPKLLVPSPTAVETLGADFALNPVGTGPFKFVEFADQQHVRLARNDNYSWGPAALGSGPVEIGEIEFRVLSDAIAQVNAVRTGEIDVAHSPPLSVQNLGGLEADGFVVLRGATRGAPFSFIFNVENVPDVRVRQALAHATDKQRLMDTVFQGQYQAATAVITQSTPGFPGYEFYPFDPDRARALLDEAGWLVGDGGKRYKDGEQLVLDWWNMTDFPVYDEMAPFLQAQYSTLLGVDVNLNSQSWPGIGDTLTSGIHDVGITSLKQPDGLSTMSVVLSCAGDARKGGFNWSFYCNEEVDAAVAAARQLPDGPEKYAATEAIVTQIMEDSPYIPMIEPQVVVVHPSDLGGFAFNGSDGTVLYHAVYSTDVVAAAAPASTYREVLVYVVPSLRGEDLGCPDCSLGSTLNMNPMFEPLLYREVKSGVIVEGEGRMAETWSVNDDFTEYSFKLREGMQFHGGWGELTTADVVWSHELMTRPETTSPRAALFGKMEVVVDGRYEFRLVAKDGDGDGNLDPAPDVLSQLAEQALSFMVTSKDYWGTVGEEAARLHPIGSGPYQFKEHVPGVSLTFEKFDGHYRTVPEIDEFVIQVIPESNTRFDLLTVGDADLMVGSFDQLDTVESAGLGIRSLASNRNPAIYLPFYQNPAGAAASDPPPWDSNVFGESGKLVRQALSKLVDRDEIIEFLLAGLGTTEGACIQSWWPHNPGFNEDCVPDTFDPDGALALLNQAGYDDFGDLSVSMSLGIHPAFPVCGDIAEAVAQQWRNAGVDVTSLAGDYGVMTEEGTSKREANYAFCYATPALKGAQLYGYYTRTTDRLSYTGETPEVDQLVNDALASMATGGEFEESESQKLFDHSNDNRLGISVGFADFLYFANPCLQWDALPGTAAFNIHNIETTRYNC
jgi:peptide/nickel transport system substrate-binding protein